MDIRKASIHLKSVIDGEESHRNYDGEYRFKDNSHRIVYTDYTGNAVTKVGIEATDRAMLLHRAGNITADMLFDPAAETSVNYDAFSLGSGFLLKTHSYEISCDADCVTIDIEYSLNGGQDEPGIRGRQEITIRLLEE